MHPFMMVYNITEFLIQDYVLIKYIGNKSTVEVPNGVRSISKEAFFGYDNLTSITIPGSVSSIGEEAFGCCKNLLSVTIPYSVNAIEPGAFHSCINLKNINVENGNIKYGSINGILYDKETKTLICYPAGKKEDVFSVPSSVPNIGEVAFCGAKNLKKVILHNGITQIPWDAFHGCDNLTIQCTCGSEVHWYALDNDINFEFI